MKGVQTPKSVVWKGCFPTQCASAVCFFRCDGFPGACFPVCSPLLPLPPRASAVCFSGAMVFPQCVQARGRGSDAGAQAEEHHAAHAQKGVHRLSSTGHPGSERELAGDNGEAHTVRQARAEKHQAKN